MTLATTESPPLPPPTLLHLPTPSLTTSLFLPQLFSLINRAYDAGHQRNGRQLLLPSSTIRLRTPSQLSEEIGPNGFTIIMLRRSSDSEEEKVIATTSAKPFMPYTFSPGNASEGIEDHNILSKRRPTADEPSPFGATKLRWEILAMAVDPPLQGRGLASQMLRLVIEEIKARATTKVQVERETEDEETNKAEQEEEGQARRKLTLMLSTMQECNENFYVKRGWRTTSVKRFEPGVGGSKEGFGVAEMVRMVDF